MSSIGLIRRINLFHGYKSLKNNVKPLKPIGHYFGINRSFHLSGLKLGLRSKYRVPTLTAFKKLADHLKEKGEYPQDIRSQYAEWNYDSELYAFGKRFKEDFHPQLLREAFTDPSYIFKETKRLESLGLENSNLQLKSNKDLSEAGAALIQNFSKQYFRAVYCQLPEEGIESIADFLSSDQVLAKISKELGFRDLILTQEFPPSERTYSRSFAAVVSCLNASSGLERCHRFILDFVVTQLIDKDIWDIWEVNDPLYLLQSLLLQCDRGVPEPRLLGDIGRNTIEAVFYVGIYDGDKQLIGKGFGETVDMGTTVAAYDALSRMFCQTASKPALPFQKNDGLVLLSKNTPNPSIHEWNRAN